MIEYQQYQHLQECHLKKKDINVFENIIKKNINSNNYTNFTYLWQF